MPHRPAIEARGPEPCHGQRETEFISIIGATTASIPANKAGETIGLLATDGASASGIYQSALTAAGYRVALLSPEDQATLMRLVHEVNAGLSGSVLRVETGAVADSLRSQGARIAVAGCTELSTLLDGQANMSRLQVIDPAVELARKTVARATNRA